MPGPRLTTRLTRPTFPCPTEGQSTSALATSIDASCFGWPGSVTYPLWSTRAERQAMPPRIGPHGGPPPISLHPMTYQPGPDPFTRLSASRPHSGRADRRTDPGLSLPNDVSTRTGSFPVRLLPELRPLLSRDNPHHPEPDPRTHPSYPTRPKGRSAPHLLDPGDVPTRARQQTSPDGLSRRASPIQVNSSDVPTRTPSLPGDDPHRSSSSDRPRRVNSSRMTSRLCPSPPVQVTNPPCSG